jgi:N utilization substance protein B
MGARRRARILAFQALYAWGVNRRTAPADLFEFSWLDEDRRNGLGESADFSRLLIQGTIEKIGDVDGMIRRCLQNWDISRLNQVDLALLRMSVYTLIFQDTPPSVVINEAVCIAKEFGTDDSSRFINGVLDGVRRTLEQETEPRSVS